MCETPTMKRFTTQDGVGLSKLEEVFGIGVSGKIALNLNPVPGKPR